MTSSFERYLKGQLKRPKVMKGFEEERRIQNIGLALKEARMRHRLSQQDLARHLGISVAKVSRTERYPEHSTIQTLERYAHAVGMELDFRLVRQ